MSARQKLNIAYINSAILFAAVLGGIFQSWTVFVIVAIVLVAMAIYSGSIRGSRRH